MVDLKLSLQMIVSRSMGWLVFVLVVFSVEVDKLINEGENCVTEDMAMVGTLQTLLSF